jgi:hypothetical protein
MSLSPFGLFEIEIALKAINEASKLSDVLILSLVDIYLPSYLGITLDDSDQANCTYSHQFRRLESTIRHPASMNAAKPLRLVFLRSF